jgi:glycosyltransferase involved in cell wall biosynthesis
MRVLQLGKYYYPYMGGMENHLYLLCDELKHKVELEVVVANDVAKTVHERVDGVDVTRCLQAANVASTSLCPTMPWELSLRRYDVLHLHFPHPMGVVSYLGSKKPRKHAVVVTYHSDIVRQERLLQLYAPVMNQVLRRADAILCTSPNYIESSETLRKFRSKCRVLPYGIDLRQFARSAELERQAADIRSRFPGPRLIAVGRLIYYKGFEYLVRAMADIDAHLLLVGDGPLKGSLQALARECGAADRVHFVGNVHNAAIAPWYFASEVFVLPSIARSEAFGIVQLEAMACGLPVVNTALDSGVPFASRHEESGLTVPPEDPKALAAAINALLANPEKRKALGEAGRERVQREFSRQQMGKRVLALYEELTTPGLRQTA